MQKTILLLIAHFFVLTSLFAIQIERITDISNGEMLFDYDRYAGAITGIEDRVFMQNAYSLEEFEILADGSLNRIAHFETSIAFGLNMQVYQDRLYVFSNRQDTSYYPHYYFRVYDLTQRPMVQIADFDTPEIITDEAVSVNYHGSHIYISYWYSGNRTAKYSTETFAFEGFVQPALGGVWVRIVGDTLFDVNNTGNDFILQLYDFVDEQKVFLSDIVLPVDYLNSGATWAGQSFNGSNYVLAHRGGAVVVDFSDISNPVLVADISVNTEGFSIKSIFYNGEHLVLSNMGTRLWAYAEYETGDFTFLGSKETGVDISGNYNLYVKDDFVLNQGGMDLKVFDLSTPSIDEIYRYGTFNMAPMNSIFPYRNELYYLWLDWDTFAYQIYSILDNELVASVPNNHPNFDYIQQFIRHFEIMYDKLYVLVYSENSCWFEIYNIIDQQATLANSLQLSPQTSSFNVINDKVFISTGGGINVYSIDDNQLTYIGLLSESMGSRKVEPPCDFFITYSGGSVFFRDINDYQNIIFTATLPFQIMEICYIDNGYLLVKPYSENLPRTASIYKYDIFENSIHLFHTFPTRIGNTVHCFDGIITDNAYHEATSSYYAILNDELVMIGEKGDDRNRTLWETYFYPARGKMVQVAWSGIWVYDFEYEEYVTESDVSVPAGGFAALHGNYPNPFNPSTTISFSLGCTERVVIDVYNVRGQRVRSLVSGVYGAGEHTVVWNGCGDDGIEVGSGVYFYRMVSGRYTGVKKMLLVK